MKIPGGLFFLIACLGLVALEAGGKQYMMLVVLHLGGGLLAYLLMGIGIRGIPLLINIAEFMVHYMIPVLSMTLVLLVMESRKGKI